MSPAHVPPWLRRLAWAGLLLWGATITCLSSMSARELARFSQFTFWDKAEHFLAFATGSAILLTALRWSTEWRAMRLVPVTILAISLFGAIDEIHQLFTPGRSGGDLFDWTADTLGAAAGVLAALIFHARHSRSRLLASAGD